MLSWELTAPKLRDFFEHIEEVSVHYKKHSYAQVDSINHYSMQRYSTRIISPMDRFGNMTKPKNRIEISASNLNDLEWTRLTTTDFQQKFAQISSFLSIASNLNSVEALQKMFWILFEQYLSWKIDGWLFNYFNQMHLRYYVFVIASSGWTNFQLPKIRIPSQIFSQIESNILIPIALFRRWYE